LKQNLAHKISLKPNLEITGSAEASGEICEIWDVVTFFNLAPLK